MLCASLLRPGSPSVVNTTEPYLPSLLGSFPLLFWPASASATVTPGFSMNSKIVVSPFTPVTLETTLTVPDCAEPLTVIDDAVAASDRVGSVDAACAEEASARQALAATTAAEIAPHRARRLR